MINTYLSLEYIAIVLFGLILVLFSVGSTYLNFEKDNKTNGGDVEYIKEDIDCPYGTFEGEGMPSDDDFFEKYDVVKNVLGDHGSYDGYMFETFGHELDYVLQINQNNPKKVWTLIEGDEGEYIASGFHLVNRMGYFVTVEEREKEFEEYKCEDLTDHEEEELTDFEKAKRMLEENGITVSDNSTDEDLYVFINDMEINISEREIKFQASRYDETEW